MRAINNINLWNIVCSEGYDDGNGARSPSLEYPTYPYMTTNLAQMACSSLLYVSFFPISKFFHTWRSDLPIRPPFWRVAGPSLVSFEDRISVYEPSEVSQSL